LLESGSAECPGDPNYPGFYNPNDSDEQFRYNAEGHTIKATLFGSSTSQPQSTCAVVAGTTQVYNYDWGVNGILERTRLQIGQHADNSVSLDQSGQSSIVCRRVPAAMHEQGRCKRPVRAVGLRIV
jgi:hypothetical protein